MFFWGEGVVIDLEFLFHESLSSKFFWELVSPYISEGIKFLRRTQTGQVWVQNLYANVFKEEHDTEVYGPERAGNRN